MTGGAKWMPRTRDYVLENRQWAAEKKPIRNHPLLKTADSGQGKKEVLKEKAPTPKPKPKGIFDDPLAMGTGDDDPLGLFNDSPTPAQEVHVDTSSSSGGDAEGKKAGFEDWSAKVPRVLTKYTTNKRIAVTCNFLEEPEDAGPKVVDQAKNRLEQLEQDEESDEAKTQMTQKEYIAHMEEQHTKLKQAWENGERVVALKIAIQCAKLLGDTTVPAFYPSMYSLLTMVLDTFGDLVFQRIKGRGVDLGNGKGPTALPNSFKASDVCGSAQDTCRNWFFKTACIRELVPRLYIDMALIKSNRFLPETNYVEIFNRLSRAIRGIGDPLAATFARAFLTTKLNDVTRSYRADPSVHHPPNPELKQSILEALDDFMFTYRSIREDDFACINHVKEGKVSADEYVDLYSPALEWLLQNIGYQSNDTLFFALLEQYRDYCNNSAVLVHILGFFQPSFVSTHALSMCTFVKEAVENSQVKKSKLYLTLGKCLLACPPPKKQQLPILNEVWKVVTKIEDPDEYVEIAQVFVQYLLTYFSTREVNIFLKDVIKHLKKDQAYLQRQEQLQTIVMKVMEHNKDLTKTLSMDNFLPVIDLLERPAKVPAGKIILKAFERSSIASTSDPVIIHTLFDVARSMHDSLDSMTFADERRQIGDLIVNFVRKVDFGRDLEKQLNMYVDCRQAFTSLDKVTSELVLRVVKLANRAHFFMKGKHTRKTSTFVKACLAYCHITIPSLEDNFTRLHLFLQCGEVALVNNMIVQGEGFLKAAISLIPSVPAKQENPISKKIFSTETELVGFLRNFASFLLYFPGHPGNGPFYLIKGMLNAVNAYEPWQEKGSVGKTKTYLGVLGLFCTYYQSTFPTHITMVESNDSLYGGDAAYKEELLGLLNSTIESIVAQLADIGAKGDLVSKKQQGSLALELVNLLVAMMEMNPTSATMVVKLYSLAQKTGAVDKAYLSATLAHIKGKKGTWYEDVSNKIAAM